jgi:membrane protein YqaA with SNARE-associated domain
MIRFKPYYRNLILFTLFFMSFLSATLLPVASEIYFVYCLKIGISPILAILVATFGNTLGSITTYFVGSFGKTKWLLHFGFTKEKLDRFQIQFKKHGISLALLAWVPIIGDVFVLFLGYFRTSKTKTFTYFFIGKLLRYSVIAWIFYK